MSKLPFPERVLHQHIATLGKTGAGKSSAMRVIAEHLLDHDKRTTVIDPKGDWWGLKSSADGKAGGYPVIMFGDFKEPRASDVPINDRSGKHVAELIATGNRPCVLGFRGWMPAQLVRFWLEFAPALFNTNEGELYLIIDEVHNFAPKGKIMDPDSGKCLHWTNRIMSEGRGLGLTFFIASQRPQKVHNDTLDCCETLIAMRVAHPAARQSVKDWIDGNGDPAKGKEVLATLAQLKRGEAWVWSPENEVGPTRVQFPMFSTFDSFAPPQLQKRVTNSGWSTVDLEAVKQKLASVIAEQKANDPKELKAEVVRLKQELAKKHSAGPVKSVPVVDERAVERAVGIATREFRKQLGEAMKIIAKVHAIGFDAAGVSKEEVEKALQAATAQITKLAQEKIKGRALEFDKLRRQAASALERMRLILADEHLETSVTVERREPFKVEIRPVQQITGNGEQITGNGELSAAQIRVLSRLVELMQCTGQSSVRKEQLAAWAEYSPNSGGFNNYLGSLRSAGMIDYPQPGMVTITETGRTVAEPDNIPGSSEEMLSRAKRVLGGSEGKLLEILHTRRNEMPKSSLAEESGFSPNSGGFNNYLGHMRTLGFVDYPSPGHVKCADWLYL